MKRPIRNCVGAVIFLIAVATAFYTQRVRVADLIGEASAPELPPAVGFKDASEGTVVEPPVIARSLSDEAIPLVDEKIAASPTAPRNDNVSTPSTTSIPSSFNLAVPFTSQAPFAVWDEVHEETCEEAAIYMVAEFFKGTSGVIDQTAAETELQRLVAMENETFGYYKDTTANETMILASKAYPTLRVQTMNDLTVENIKAQVASGHPVIVPTAGRMLRNPNFSGDGPPYHMIVIRGYTETQFVTNDPGTRRGNGYVYGIDTVMSAMHDWNGGDVEGGKKVVIVMYSL